MEYAAKHYVRVNGAIYMPGEILPEEALKPDELARLVDKGAVVPLGIPPAAAAPASPPEADKAKRPSARKPEPEPEAEPDEDAVPPEIDVMAGIVGGKRATKKPQAGRRKPK